MVTRDTIVIGASAGGVQALSKLVTDLPRDLPAAVFIVLHIPVKQRGGVAIVQDPLEASFPSMPMSVMQNIQVDYSLPLREIAPLLNKLSHEPAGEEGRYPVADNVEIEARIAEQTMEVTNLSPTWSDSVQYRSLSVPIVMELFGK